MVNGIYNSSLYSQAINGYWWMLMVNGYQFPGYLMASNGEL